MFSFSTCLCAWWQTEIQLCSVFLKSLKHLGGMCSSPSSLFTLSCLADINSPWRQETPKCQMLKSGKELSVLIWTERSKFSNWMAICKLFWMTNSIHSLCKIAWFLTFFKFYFSQAQLCIWKKWSKSRTVALHMHSMWNSLPDQDPLYSESYHGVYQQLSS